MEGEREREEEREREREREREKGREREKDVWRKRRVSSGPHKRLLFPTHSSECLHVLEGTQPHANSQHRYSNSFLL